MKKLPNIQYAIAYAKDFLINTGQTVNSENWQGIKAPAPMHEALNLIFQTPMPVTKPDLERLCPPSTPWAEMHFQERIGGIPLNPPPSHEHWPFGVQSNKEFTNESEQFDHTYPERFWPKHAGEWGDNEDTNNMGIRFEYGDLNDVIEQLYKDPFTRQAYLPIFFPEDTGARGGKGRVPCTLGYHFILRNGYLHMSYYMRSCDYKRHFVNDLYLAVRLAQHVASQVWELGNEYHRVKSGLIRPGILTFHAVSFHIFEPEFKALCRE